MISAIGGMAPIAQPMASLREPTPQAAAAPPQTGATTDQVLGVLESQGETAQAAAKVQVTMFRASMDMAVSFAQQMISMAGAASVYSSGGAQPAVTSGSQFDGVA